jgi:hypothetical protein
LDSPIKTPPAGQQSLAELKQATSAEIRRAATSRRPDWHAVERAIREFVATLKAADVKPERAVIEAKARVVDALGDSASQVLPAVETWARGVYYDR